MKIYPNWTSEIVENLAIEDNFQVRYRNLLLNRTPTTVHSHTIPVKNPNLDKKWVKIGEIVAKFDSNSTQKPINEK